jgi:hypothetical protein
MTAPANKIELEDASRSVSVKRVVSNSTPIPAWVVAITCHAHGHSGQIIFVRRFESLALALGFAADKLADT